MYKNRECASRMIGSAAIGVAVGMLVQKILSPRTPEKSPKLTDTARTIRFEYVQQPPEENNLRVSSYYRKYRRHHQFRSKSESGPEDRREECNCLSVPPHSLQTSKLSVSESDLRLNSGANNDMSKSSHYEKLQAVNDSTKVNSGSNNDLRDSDDVFLNTLTEYLPLKLKLSRNSSDAIENDLNLASFRESFTNKSTEYLSQKLKDVENLHVTAEGRDLNFLRGSSVSELTENSPFKFRDQKNLSDATGDLNSYCGTFSSKSTEYIPLKLRDGKYECDTARDSNVKSNRETFTSNSTEYLPLKLKDGQNFCDTANICKLKSCRKNSTGKSTEFSSKKTKNESKASKPVPLLLLDLGSKKSKAKNCLLASSIDDHTGDEISNYSIAATCDTVEKDCNFNSYSKDHTEITTENENISTSDFGTLPTFYGSKVLASIVGNESLQ